MKKLIICILSMLFLAGCGEHARIETGQVGKILGSNGLDKGIIQPSSLRLPVCLPGQACPKLIRLQVTKHTENVVIEQIFIQKSKVDLSKVEIAIQFRVRQDDKSINTIFKEIPAGKNSLITSEDIWKTYLKRQIPDVVVSVLRGYDVEGILTKIPEITKDCHTELAKSIKTIPVEITEVAFPNGIGDLPEAVISAYRKLYAVEADKQRRIKGLSADLEVEKQRLAVQRVRAENDIEISKSLGMPLATYTKLKIAEKQADAIADAADNNQPFAVGSLPFMDKQ